MVSSNMFQLILAITICVCCHGVVGRTNLETESLFREKRAFSNPPLYYDFKNGSQYNMHRIHEYDQIMDFLQQLQFENSDVMEIVDVGRTYEWRTIKGVKISSSLYNFGYKKDVFWIDGGIHAREWNTPATSVVLITKILNSILADRLSNVALVDWLVVPVMNPDGYIYSRSERRKTRMWRKNRRGCPCRPSEPGCVHEECCGVDLNRNFDAGWWLNDLDRREDAVCGETFEGSDASGEPETRSIIAYLSGLTRLRAYVTMHDSGQLWMYPYARANDTYAKNDYQLKALSHEIVSKIQSENGRVYKVGTAPELLYVATGTSSDWAADHGVEFVFTVELPPDKPFWFAIVTEGLAEAGRDMWLAVQTITDTMVYQPKYW